MSCCACPGQQLRSSIDDIVQGLARGFDSLQSQMLQRDAEIARLKFDLKLREEQLRLMRLDKYGPKSEKLSASQQWLLDLEPGVQAAEIDQEAALPESEKQLDAAAAADAATEAKSKNKSPRYIKAHSGRNKLPVHLERREIIIPCEEGAGGELIGYEEKEELVIKKAEFYVNVIKREKRRITTGTDAGAGTRSTILTAPMPPRIIEKGQLGNSIIVELLVSKYCGQARLELRRASQLSAKLSAIKSAWIEIRQQPAVLPASQLGKACGYALGQWERLIVYASHGEIVNNGCENAMRPSPLGRKN